MTLTDRQVQLAWREASETETWPEDLPLVMPWPTSSSPFAGITIERARLVRSALGGLKVSVATLDRGPRLHVFRSIRLPGDRGTAMSMIGDLILGDVDSEGREGCGSRVLSMSLVTAFEVVQREPDYVCWQCGGTILPNEKVYDLGGLGRHPNGVAIMNHGEYEWEQRFECRTCWWTEG